MASAESAVKGLDKSEARALNVRVASVIMGWTQWTDLSGDCPDTPGLTVFADWGDSADMTVYVNDGDDDEGEPDFYFNPAEDMDDAWRVLERMRERGWLMHVLAMLEGYVVNANETGGRDGMVQIPCDTAQEGICLAALKAVEVAPAPLLPEGGGPRATKV